MRQKLAILEHPECVYPISLNKRDTSKSEITSKTHNHCRVNPQSQTAKIAYLFQLLFLKYVQVEKRDAGQFEPIIEDIEESIMEDEGYIWKYDQFVDAYESNSGAGGVTL